MLVDVRLSALSVIITMGIHTSLDCDTVKYDRSQIMTGVSSKRSQIKWAASSNKEPGQTGTQDKRGAKLFAEFKHSNRGGIGMTHQI
jgi:hypothetical protein